MRLNLVLAGVAMTTVPVVTWVAATGRLRRNGWAGVRTSTFLRSEATWMRGHRLVMPYALACSLLSWSIVGVALLLHESGRKELAGHTVLASVVVPSLVALVGAGVATRKLKRDDVG